MIELITDFNCDPNNELKMALDNLQSIYDKGFKDGKTNTFPSYTGELLNTKYQEPIKGEEEKTIENNNNCVYTSGYWDGFQDSGKRTSYTWGFQKWDIVILNPKYLIKPSSAQSIFDNCAKLTTINIDKFDFSNLDTTGDKQMKSAKKVFYKCTSLIKIPDLKIPAVICYDQTFANCTKLETIEVIRIKKETSFMSCFNQCKALININSIEDDDGNKENIIFNDIAFEESENLSKETLERIIKALSPLDEGKTATLTINTNVFNDETRFTEELRDLIDKKTGWIVLSSAGK